MRKDIHTWYEETKSMDICRYRGSDRRTMYAHRVQSRIALFEVPWYDMFSYRRKQLTQHFCKMQHGVKQHSLQQQRNKAAFASNRMYSNFIFIFVAIKKISMWEQCVSFWVQHHSEQLWKHSLRWYWSWLRWKAPESLFFQVASVEL